MLVPSLQTPTAPNADHKDLAAALKLLAGHECHRDAQQAHTMLVRLTESDVRNVADDARAVLADGLRKDWFGDRKPFYQDLIALATRTEGGRKSGAPARLILALVAGLLALVLGVFFFLQQSQPDVEMPILAVVVGILIVVLAGAMALKK